jgi:dihydropteroate synthase
VLGLPLLVGASRKAFLGRLLADEVTANRDRRYGATMPARPSRRSVAVAGAWCVGPHAVAASADAVRVASRWEPDE